MCSDLHVFEVFAALGFDVSALTCGLLVPCLFLCPSVRETLLSHFFAKA